MDGQLLAIRFRNPAGKECWWTTHGGDGVGLTGPEPTGRPYRVITVAELRIGDSLGTCRDRVLSIVTGAGPAPSTLTRPPPDRA
jgi:hypothetical protein